MRMFASIIEWFLYLWIFLSWSFPPLLSYPNLSLLVRINSKYASGHHPQEVEVSGKIAVFWVRTQVGATKEPTIIWPNIDAL